MGEALEQRSYQAAIDYILSFADYERASRSSLVWDLRRMDELLGRLGNPQAVARSIQIAGTKGKGSTAAMIASALATAGYRTGLYTSPHLLSFTERIQVDAKPIVAEEFATVVEKLKPEIEAVNRHGAFGELTTFEILTALAFVYFKERKVDFQVLETGLGGRLDATNVVHSEVCAITSISLDHMEVLGDSLARIAAEKTGIIKPRSIVICALQTPEALAVIKRACQDKGARLIEVGKDVTWQRKSSSLAGQSFQLKGTMYDHEFTIPLLGEYQLENAAIAVATLEALTERGVKILPVHIVHGLAQVHWPGRLQVLEHEPLLIVDGAHNADSAKRLMQALRQYFSFERLILIVGTSYDKDVSGIVQELSPLPSTIIATRSRNPRALETARLAAEFSKWGITPKVAENVTAAVGLARDLAMPKDLICATGSLFVVAEVMEYIEQDHLKM
jgi:dihydrofolate synthase/folylpolyglutamate synthase